MKSLFFYGTLRFVPLLELVLGRPADALDIREATLDGHQVFWVRNQPFPMISETEGVARGMLVGDLSDSDIEKLNYYEGGFDYALKPITVLAGDEAIETEVYFPAPGLWEKGDLWSLEDWVNRWGEVTLIAAREVMSYIGRFSATEVASLFPMIRARAKAQLNARAVNHAYSPSKFGREDVDVDEISVPYVNYFTLEEYDLAFRRYDGGKSGMVNRVVFVATDAVIVLPYDPVRDRVLLIEQFRPGPFARGDEKPWQLEPIAGRVDGFETPEQTAHREAWEEAGLTLSDLHEVAHCYASPGCSTEYYNIYLGIADLPDTVEGVAGLESESEDIRSYVFSYDELMQLVDNMQAVNAPLVLAGLWLARHRERLRGGS